MVTTDQITGMLADTLRSATSPGFAFSDGKPSAPHVRPWAVGNDVVALSVFRNSCTPQFIRRVFTREELDYCAQFSDPLLRYASTWAAKEAVYKALKQVDENLRFWWRDIEISRNKPSGKPSVSVKNLPFPIYCSLTLSHEEDIVWAVAVIQYQGG